MDIKTIIKQIPEDEHIAVRLYDSNDNLTYVITLFKTQVGRIRELSYKLYEYGNLKLAFTGKEANTPLELESMIGG